MSTYVGFDTSGYAHPSYNIKVFNLVASPVRRALHCVAPHLGSIWLWPNDGSSAEPWPGSYPDEQRGRCREGGASGWGQAMPFC